MRIGLISGEYPPMRGGVGDFTRQLALALARAGHEIHLIVPTGAARPAPPGLTLHPVIRRWSFPALFQIRRIAAHADLHLLDLQYQALAYGMTLPIHFLPLVAGRPVVVTFHDWLAPYLFPKAGPLRPAIVRQLARSAAGVIVTNSEDERQLPPGTRSAARIPIGSNIPVAPPDGYDRDQWREQAGVAAGEFLVGFFGFLNPAKGGATLLEAVERLSRRGLPVRLALIGGGTEGDFHQRLENIDARARLGDRAILTGFLPPAAVSAWLLACDALALPYPGGATLRSGSLLAGLSHGCPVVIPAPASEAAVPELAHGENIYFVPRAPGRLAEAGADGRARLWADPALRARLSAGARATARAFDWEAIAAQTAGFFERIRAASP